MSNSTRNTIALAIILLLVGSFWLVQVSTQSAKTRKLKLENAITKHAVDSMSVELADIDSLKREYSLKEALMNQQSKLIFGQDSPTITYGYLLDILRSNSLNVIYDFASTGTDKSGDSFNEYVISGKTKYANLLNLTKQLEHQRGVITIEDFSIGSEGVARADTVSFSMVLHTHFYPGGPAAADLTLKTLERPFTGYPLFQPRIADEILPYDVDPTLMVVENARLIGISRGQAFFRDDMSIIRILSRGSRVAYGYLHRIDQEAGKVVFRLDKYGLEEDYTVLINNSQ